MIFLTTASDDGCYELFIVRNTSRNIFGNKEKNYKQLCILLLIIAILAIASFSKLLLNLDGFIIDVFTRILSRKITILLVGWGCCAGQFAKYLCIAIFRIADSIKSAIYRFMNFADQILFVLFVLCCIFLLFLFKKFKNVS